MHPFTFSISFRIWGDFDVKELSRILGLKPTYFGHKGDIRGYIGKTGEPVFAKRSYICKNFFRVSDRDIIKSINKICTFFEKKGKRYLEVSKLFHAELFIALYGAQNFGFTIDQDTLKRVERLGLELSFDIYPEAEKSKKRKKRAK